MAFIKSLSGNKTIGVSRADNSVKIWRNLPISNPKPDLYSINAHTKFNDNPLMFTQVIIHKRTSDGRTYGRSNISGLRVSLMLNFHKGLGAISKRFRGYYNVSKKE